MPDIDFSDIIGMICSVLSLLAAILIGLWQIHQNSRVNKLTVRQSKEARKQYENMLYSEATKFILKYSSPDYDSEILLLPLCVMAYKYNPIYPYAREIYREFCILSEDLQALILKRCDVEIETGRCSEFFDHQVSILKAVIAKNYPGDMDIFYDGAKYFERALLHHGSIVRPEITCAVDKYQQESYDNPIWAGPKKPYMFYNSHITNLLAYEKSERPMFRLFGEATSLGVPSEDDEILTSYLCCEVAKYVACYSYTEGDEILDTGSVCDFSGSWTMEDFFLDALCYVYCYCGFKFCTNDKRCSRLKKLSMDD